MVRCTSDQVAVKDLRELSFKEPLKKIDIKVYPGFCGVRIVVDIEIPLYQDTLTIFDPISTGSHIQRNKYLGPVWS